MVPHDDPPLPIRRYPVGNSFTAIICVLEVHWNSVVWGGQVAKRRISNHDVFWLAKAILLPGGGVASPRVLDFQVFLSSRWAKHPKPKPGVAGMRASGTAELVLDKVRVSPRDLLHPCRTSMAGDRHTGVEPHTEPRGTREPRFGASCVSNLDVGLCFSVIGRYGCRGDFFIQDPHISHKRSHIHFHNAMYFKLFVF